VLYPCCCRIDDRRDHSSRLRIHDGRRKTTEVRSFGTTTGETSVYTCGWLMRIAPRPRWSRLVDWRPVFKPLESSFGIMPNPQHIKGGACGYCAWQVH
jgi:hypothetical protein